jgi:hypothetical protein
MMMADAGRMKDEGGRMKNPSSFIFHPLSFIPCVIILAGCVTEPTAAPPPVRRPVERARRELPALPPEVPAVNLPLDARQRNYSGGSCVFASMCSALRWQNHDEIARAMRESCHGGSGQARLHASLRRLGAAFVFTSSGDVRFLEWAARTRRGAMIFYFPNHAVTLVDLTASEALLLDNNRVQRYLRIPREEFVRRWRGYGGAATVPLVAPPAPPL